MFASLLAASLASNLGLVGCTRTEADMKVGFVMPSGSKSLPGEVGIRPFAEAVGEKLAVAELASGCGAAEEDEDAETGVWRGESGCGAREKEGESGDRAAGARGDDVDLTNMDFVPSTNRPPRGGLSTR